MKKRTIAAVAVVACSGLAVWKISKPEAGPVMVSNLKSETPSEGGAIREPEGRKEASPKEYPPYPSGEDLKEIDAEGRKLSGLLRSQLQEKDEEFFQTLGKILHEYRGDPALLLEEFHDLLSSDRLEIRLEMARSYLEMGVHQGEAVAVLQGILKQSDPGRLRYKGESYVPKRSAAQSLARYGGPEVANDLWDYYLETKDWSVFPALVKLGDERPKQVIAPVAGTTKGALSYIGLLGQYQLTDAVEPLAKVIAGRDQQGDSPDYERYEAESALYQLTGDPSHLKYLFEHSGDTSSLRELLKLKVPEVREFLQQLVLDNRVTVSEPALVGLYASYPDDPVVKKVVMDYLQSKVEDPKIAWETIFHVASSLRDPQIDELGQKYANRTWNRSWMIWHNRRNWPFNSSVLE